MNIHSLTFSKATKTYDLWAKHQKLAASSLVTLLPDINFKKILDAGCGTGLLLQEAYKRYSNATFLGVDKSEEMIKYCQTRFGHIKNMNFLVHDLEKLNEVNFSSPFDLILSNFTLQWIDNIDRAVEIFFNSLGPGGYLGIAVPIKDSIFELHNSFKSAFGYKMPGLDYRNSDDYISTLKQYAFSICTSQVDDLCVTFDGIDVLRYFKYTGTTFRHDPSYCPKTVKEINTLLAHYEKNYGGNNKLLPLTFKILFIIVQKHIKQPLQSRNNCVVKIFSTNPKV